MTVWMVALILFLVLYFPLSDNTKTDVVKRTYTCAPYWFVSIKKNRTHSMPGHLYRSGYLQTWRLERIPTIRQRQNITIFFFHKRTAIKKNPKRFVHFPKTTLNLNKSIRDLNVLSKHSETIRGGECYRFFTFKSY